MKWARDPFFAPDDAYWLPLPFWIFGSWRLLIGERLGLYWHVPAASGCMALGAFGLMQATRRLERQLFPEHTRPLAAWFALALSISIPLCWRMASCGLSEPVQLAAQSLMLWALVWCIQAPTVASRAALLATLMAQQAIRYEVWPLTFATWLVVCLMMDVPNLTRQTRLRLLAAGWFVLALFPLVWLALNATRNHDPFYFLNVAKVATHFPVLDPDQPSTFLERMGFIALLAWTHGWWIIILAIAGFGCGWRCRSIKILAAVVAIAWLLYFQGAFSSIFGSERPQRFALSPLWLGIPPAALAMATAWSARQRVWRWGVATLIFFLFSNPYQADLTDWGGRIPSEFDREKYHQLDLLCRRGTILVIDNSANAIPTIPLVNRMRIFVGLDHVQTTDWYTGQTKEKRGRFLYFVNGRRLPGVPIWDFAFNHFIFLLDHMPPPPSVPSKIDLEGRAKIP